MYIQLFQINPCSVMYEPTQYTNMTLYAYKSRVDL